MIEFGSFPERLYVIKDGKVARQGGMGPFDYKVRRWRPSFLKIKSDDLFQSLKEERKGCVDKTSMRARKARYSAIGLYFEKE